MSDLELVRVAISEAGCFGVLVHRGVPLGQVTLERTWPIAESEPSGAQLVKIPAGKYVCKRTHFIRGGYDTYEVTGVVGHSRLLFHRGNHERDSDGCILVGQKFGSRFMAPGVEMSALGFGEFMTWTDGRESFELEVRGA